MSEHKPSEKYEGTGDLERQWETFGRSNLPPEKKVKIGTLAHIATENGWTPSDNDPLGLNNEQKHIEPFKFQPIKNLINDIPANSWLIRNYFEKDTVSLIYGKPGCGKSFLAIDIACCVATGTEYHGNKTEQGAVFYIAGEGYNGLRKRFRAWQDHYNTSIENAPLYVSERATEIYDKDHVVVLKKAITEREQECGQKPTLIIIDTLARNFGPGDENSTGDMSTFIKNVDTIRKQWCASIMIVHHVGHGDDKRARGSSALKGALDHEYSIEKPQNTNSVSMKCSKSKDCVDPLPLNFELKTVELPFKDDLDNPMTSAVLKYISNIHIKPPRTLRPQTQAALDVLEYLIENEGKEIDVPEFKAKQNAVKLSDFREQLKTSDFCDTDKPDSIRTAIKRAIDDIIKLRKAMTYGDYIFIPDTPDISRHLEFDILDAPDGQDKSL